MNLSSGTNKRNNALSGRKGREFALQLAYSMEVGRQGLPESLKGVTDSQVWSEEARLYGLTLAEKYLENQESIESEIKSAVSHWDVDRIAVVDRLLISLATTEMLYMADVPVKVCISEAINLAKKYSTEQSGRFVNGILDALAKRHSNLQ